MEDYDKSSEIDNININLSSSSLESFESKEDNALSTSNTKYATKKNKTSTIAVLYTSIAALITTIFIGLSMTSNGKTFTVKAYSNYIEYTYNLEEIENYTYKIELLKDTEIIYTYDLPNYKGTAKILNLEKNTNYIVYLCTVSGDVITILEEIDIKTEGK